MTDSEKQQYLIFIRALAKEAGAIARQHFSLETAFIQKSDNSPLTIADTAINSLVIEKCRQQYPDISILGEEASSGEVGRLLWVCDPIDGTIAYALGMPISSFCLALVEDGVPQISVVYDFANERLFSAIKGTGAWLNDKPMPKIDDSTQPMKLVDLEWWHTAPNNLAGVRERLLAAGWQVPNYATSSFCSMMVASGRMASELYAGAMPWDVAAAKVIAEECGALVTDIDGNDQRYDQPIKGALVTHPRYQEEILAAIHAA